MTEHGEFIITPATVRWIMANIKTSMFNNQRSYVYNKAFARFYDNNNAYDQYSGKTKSGGLQNDNKVCGEPQYELKDCGNCDCENDYERDVMDQYNQFDLIRAWAMERGLYDKGDVKTQTLKLMEEAGEICKATLKEDHEEIIDGIGDCVVVLTNLAELHGVSIEECIDAAYNEIKNRKGKMANGTYVKQ